MQLEMLKSLAQSPALQVLLKPLFDMWDDAKSIFRQENATRCWLHLLITFSVFVTGAILSFYGAHYANWISKIVHSIGLPAALEPLFIAYLGAWALGYPASFITKQSIRAGSMCVYGDPDFVHTTKDCSDAAEKLSIYTEDDSNRISGVQVKALLDFCVLRINEPGKRHNAEWYIECRRKILHGDLESFYELTDTLENEKHDLREQKRKLDIEMAMLKDKNKKHLERKSSTLLGKTSSKLMQSNNSSATPVNSVSPRTKAETKLTPQTKTTADHDEELDLGAHPTIKQPSSKYTLCAEAIDDRTAEKPIANKSTTFPAQTAQNTLHHIGTLLTDADAEENTTDQGDTDAEYRVYVARRAASKWKQLVKPSSKSASLKKKTKPARTTTEMLEIPAKPLDVFAQFHGVATPSTAKIDTSADQLSHLSPAVRFSPNSPVASLSPTKDTACKIKIQPSSSDTEDSGYDTDSLNNLYQMLDEREQRIRREMAALNAATTDMPSYKSSTEKHRRSSSCYR